MLKTTFMALMFFYEDFVEVRDYIFVKITTHNIIYIIKYV